MLRFPCPHCAAGLNAKPELAGRTVRCPKCSEKVTVAAPAASPDAPKTRTAAPVQPTRQQSRPLESEDDPYRLASSPREKEASAPKPPAVKGASSQPAPSAFVPAAGKERRVLLEQLVRGFNGDFKRPRRGVGYRLMELVVFTLILLLPVLYVAMIVGAGWGTYWYAVHATGMFTGVRGRAAGVAFAIYLAPLIGGASVVFSMIVPLFVWPRREDGPRRSLNRSAEPLLFAMVDRLCDVVGARRPARIDVDCSPNASAGMMSFFSNQLVLTIGLPLAAGMTAPQLVGVLAHEFGHFTQGLTSRLNYAMSSILRWFAMAAYSVSPLERVFTDSHAVGGEGGCLLAIVGGIVKLFVLAARLALQACFYIGWGASMTLLRRMEYDADAFEYGVVGSEVFERTTKKLPLLAKGWELGLMVAVNKAPAFDGLPEDLPGFAAALADDPTADMKKFGVKSRKRRTAAFDTHPADKDRIAAARAARAPGVYHVELPAAALFANFPDSCRNASFDFYRELFGSRISRKNMTANENVLGEGRRQGNAVPPPISLY